MVGPPEKRRETWQLCQKMLAELAKRQRTTTMGAEAEKRRETWQLCQKMLVQNTGDRRVRATKVMISQDSLGSMAHASWHP